MLSRSFLRSGPRLLSATIPIYVPKNNVFNKDFKPEPYPKTPEERLIAAKKYNVHPDVYEPYDDDGNGFGDYPKLPMVSEVLKDEYYPWDYPEDRRNFNEPIHAHDDILNECKLDYGMRFKLSFPEMWLKFFGFLGGTALLAWYFDDKKNYHPVLEKQYPYEGTHYGF